MKKVSSLRCLMHVIVLSLISAIYFIGGGVNQPTASWVSLFFILFSYVLVIITPIIIQNGKDKATYTTSMYTITGVYFVIELILGFLIVFKGSGGIRFAILSQLILAGICLLVLLGNVAADRHTAQAVKYHESEVAYIKEATISLKAVLSIVDDKQLYSKVERAFDTVQSSPIKSGSNVYGIETSILDEINSLNDAVQRGEIQNAILAADRIVRLANERNRELHINK